MGQRLKSSHAPLLLLAIVSVGSAYRQYQSRIPNGGRVPDPCRPGESWGGVCHHNHKGGGTLNPFGKHFKLNGESWTRGLCMADSDRDGKSNGEELGDPLCKWKPGYPVTAEATSHPGICEPLDSPKCKKINAWLKCDGARPDDESLSMCEHIATNSTFPLEVTLTPTPVPAEETVYTCQIVDLDIDLASGADLHMVATQPIIKASEVVHHILLFGCDPRVQVKQDLRTPHRCAMAPDRACRSLIGTWTLGSPGECAHPDMGFRMGVRGYRTVALQVHWNNPKRLSGLVDSSGLRIHLTRDLRQHDAGMLVVGQRYLQIPDPHDQGSSGRQFSAVCPSHCTQEMFRTPIHITSAVNHMHYRGQHQSIKLYRNNTVDQVITDQDNWSYDDPVIHNFKQGIKVNPGDEIRTVCTYKQPSTSNPVCWGEATSDEMCFGFLTYYPLQSLAYPWCVSVKKFPSCERHLPSLGRHAFDDCRWWEFRNTSHPATRRLTGSVFTHCYPGQSKSLQCTRRCREVALEVVSHPCLKGETGSYMIDKFKQAGGTARMILDAVLTCSCGRFDYCDRKYHGGMLGSRREEFCPSPASFLSQDKVLALSLLTLVHLAAS